MKGDKTMIIKINNYQFQMSFDLQAICDSHKEKTSYNTVALPALQVKKIFKFIIEYGDPDDFPMISDFLYHTNKTYFNYWTYEFNKIAGGF